MADTFETVVNQLKENNEVRSQEEKTSGKMVRTELGNVATTLAGQTFELVSAIGVSNKILSDIAKSLNSAFNLDKLIEANRKREAIDAERKSERKEMIGEVGGGGPGLGFGGGVLAGKYIDNIVGFMSGLLTGAVGTGGVIAGTAAVAQFAKKFGKGLLKKGFYGILGTFLVDFVVDAIGPKFVSDEDLDPLKTDLNAALIGGLLFGIRGALIGLTLRSLEKMVRFMAGEDVDFTVLDFAKVTLTTAVLGSMVIPGGLAGVVKLGMGFATVFPAVIPLAIAGLAIGALFVMYKFLNGRKEMIEEKTMKALEDADSIISNKLETIEGVSEIAGENLGLLTKFTNFMKGDLSSIQSVSLGLENYAKMSEEELKSPKKKDTLERLFNFVDFVLDDEKLMAEIGEKPLKSKEFKKMLLSLADPEIMRVLGLTDEDITNLNERTAKFFEVKKEVDKSSNPFRILFGEDYEDTLFRLLDEDNKELLEAQAIIGDIALDTIKKLAEVDKQFKSGSIESIKAKNKIFEELKQFDSLTEALPEELFSFDTPNVSRLVKQIVKEQEDFPTGKITDENVQEGLIDPLEALINFIKQSDKDFDLEKTKKSLMNYGKMLDELSILEEQIEKIATPTLSQNLVNFSKYPERFSAVPGELENLLKLIMQQNILAEQLGMPSMSYTSNVGGDTSVITNMSQVNQLASQIDTTAPNKMFAGASSFGLTYN